MNSRWDTVLIKQNKTKDKGWLAFKSCSKVFMWEYILVKDIQVPSHWYPSDCSSYFYFGMIISVKVLEEATRTSHRIRTFHWLQVALKVLGSIHANDLLWNNSVLLKGTFDRRCTMTLKNMHYHVLKIDIGI